MRYKTEIDNIVNKMSSIQYDVEILVNQAYQDAVLHERSQIKTAIVQYALDNHLLAKDIEPFINIIEERGKINGRL